MNTCFKKESLVLEKSRERVTQRSLAGFSSRTLRVWYRYLFLVILLVILIIVLAITITTGSQTTKTSGNAVISQSDRGAVETENFQTQTNKEGEVTVEVTPVSLERGKKATFQLRLNTHSVELDYDFGGISQLTDDKKNTYKPLSWDGGKGGHHISGILTFQKISIQTKSVTLFIPQIDNLDRKFTWNLQ